MHARPPHKQSATPAHHSPSRGTAAAVIHSAGETDARLMACTVRLPVLTLRRTQDAQRPSVRLPQKGGELRAAQRPARL
jgi:hypothetical protein